MASDPRVNVVFTADEKPRCAFCEIVYGQAPATKVYSWPAAVAIMPLNPVTAGHVLVIPKAHVPDASVDPMLTGLIAGYAAQFAVQWTKDGDYNLIVNCGETASQSQPHLHWHIVPRREGDGLHLPWTGQVTT
jgi:histidine triad (HIT) family protein